MSAIDLLRGDPPPSGYFHLNADEASEILALERDLAQARQALQLTVGALEIWENAVGEINVWPLECRKALAVAREALVERGTEQDLGGDETSPVAQEGQT